MSKIHMNNGRAFWHCPGCGHSHGVPVDPAYESPVRWEFNADLEKPTFSPSVLCQSQFRCHCFIKDGMIQFLTDCDHALAGQTVEIPEWAGWAKAFSQAGGQL